MDRYVWVIIYYDDFDSDEPVVTAFDNEIAANRCYKEFNDEGKITFIEKVPLYSIFTVD